MPLINLPDVIFIAVAEQRSLVMIMKTIPRNRNKIGRRQSERRLATGEEFLKATSIAPCCDFQVSSPLQILEVVDALLKFIDG